MWTKREPVGLHAAGDGTTPVSRRALAAALDWLNSIQIATSKIRSKVICFCSACRTDFTCWREKTVLEAVPESRHVSPGSPDRRDDDAVRDRDEPWPLTSQQLTRSGVTHSGTTVPVCDLATG